MNVGCIPKKLMHQAAILGMFFSQTICVIAKGDVLEQVFRLKMHHRWVHLRTKGAE